jgi:bacteriocin-like protein
MFNMFKKQGTSKRSASTSSGDIKPGFDEATPTDMGQQASACDMAMACEELELSDEELATVVGGYRVNIQQQFAIALQRSLSQARRPVMSWQQFQTRYPGIQSRSGF